MPFFDELRKRMRNNERKELGHLACIFGVSGVGKSFLIRQFCAKNRGWVELKASHLLTAETRQNIDDLRKNGHIHITQNQYKLVEAVRRIQATTHLNYLLDGHCVIDNDSELVAVPDEVISELDPGLIVLVYDSPAAILNKVELDKKRKRAIRTKSEIKSTQDYTERTCEQYAQSIGVPFKKVRAGDEHTFANVIVGAFGTQC